MFINTPDTIFESKEKAREIADANNLDAKDDKIDPWRYSVRVFPNGKAVVDVWDEDNNQLGTL